MAVRNEPTFFEQLTMGAKADGDNSDDELEEETPPPKQASPERPKEHEIPKSKV